MDDEPNKNALRDKGMSVIGGICPAIADGVTMCLPSQSDAVSQDLVRCEYCRRAFDFTATTGREEV